MTVQLGPEVDLLLVKHGLVINKEYRNIDFDIITDNETLVIDIDLCNSQNLILTQPHRNTHTLTPLCINLTRPTEKCSNQLSRLH